MEKLGHRFCAECGALKLFVELGVEGWKVAVWHTDKKKWVMDGSLVTGPEEGKQLAFDWAKGFPGQHLHPKGSVDDLKWEEIGQ